MVKRFGGLALGVLLVSVVACGRAAFEANPGSARYQQKKIKAGDLPRGLSNLVLWLDGNDISGDGTTIQDSTGINTWIDKSDANHNLLRDDHNLSVLGDQAPLYLNYGQSERAGVHFNGATTGLEGTLPVQGKEFSLFIVLDPATARQQGSFLATSRTVSPRSFEFSVDNTLGGVNIFSDGQIRKRIGLPGEGVLTIGLLAKGDALKVYLQGKEIFKGKWPQQSLESLILGKGRVGGSHFIGLIHEVVVFERQLKDAERAKLEEYFSLKWL